MSFREFSKTSDFGQGNYWKILIMRLIFKFWTEIWHILSFSWNSPKSVLLSSAKLPSMPGVFQGVASGVIVFVVFFNRSFQVGLLPYAIPYPALSVAVNWPCKYILIWMFVLLECVIDQFFFWIWLLLPYSRPVLSFDVFWMLLTSPFAVFCLFETSELSWIAPL